MSITKILSSIDTEIAALQKARALLSTGSTGTRGGKTSASISAKPKRTMSAAGRKKIAEAQRKRWAAQRKAAKQAN